jgi:hypothetical protein
MSSLAALSLAPASDAAGSHAPDGVIDEPHRRLVKPFVSFSLAEMRAFFDDYYRYTFEVVQATESIIHLRRRCIPVHVAQQLIVVVFAQSGRMPYVCPGKGSFAFTTLRQLEAILSKVAVQECY